MSALPTAVDITVRLAAWSPVRRYTKPENTCFFCDAFSPQKTEHRLEDCLWRRAQEFTDAFLASKGKT